MSQAIFVIAGKKLVGCGVIQIMFCLQLTFTLDGITGHSKLMLLPRLQPW
jgi:hypothetical protein